MSRTQTAAALATLAFAAPWLAGCTNGDDAAATTGGPATDLVVTLDSGDGSSPQEWTLTCEPAGGTHPDPDAACATLAALDRDVLAPVAADQMCTQIFGGDQTATLTGQLQDEPVDAAFSRQDGCEIARWDAVVDVVVDQGGV